MPKKPHKSFSRRPQGPPQESITLGEFRIVTFADGRAWILHREGEGMQTDTATLSKAIEAFWKKNF